MCSVHGLEHFIGQLLDGGVEAMNLLGFPAQYKVFCCNNFVNWHRCCLFLPVVVDTRGCYIDTLRPRRNLDPSRLRTRTGIILTISYHIKGQFSIASPASAGLCSLPVLP